MGGDLLHMTPGNGGMHKVGERRRETETGWSGEQRWLLNLYRSSSEEGKKSGGKGFKEHLHSISCTVTKP